MLRTTALGTNHAARKEGRSGVAVPFGRGRWLAAGIALAMLLFLSTSSSVSSTPLDLGRYATALARPAAIYEGIAVHPGRKGRVTLIAGAWAGVGWSR